MNNRYNLHKWKRISVIIVSLLIMLSFQVGLAGKKEKDTTPIEKTNVVDQGQVQPPKSNKLIQQTTTSSDEMGFYWDMCSSGGLKGVSADMILFGALGQLSVGIGTSENVVLYQGYWQYLTCCMLRGDVNHSGEIIISDITYLVDYLFSGGPPPPCLDEADVNFSFDIGISDLTELVEYMFQGGEHPPGCIPVLN